MRPASERVLIDHFSAQSPTITHVRGIMMVNALANVRSVGMYEEYARLMPREYLEAVQQSVAMDWIPVAASLAHYEASDKLPLSDAQFASFGVRQAQRITETFLGGALRRARSLGIDTVKQTIGQIDRLHERIYRGGGCSVIDVGPKDLVFEIHGFPFATTRSFKVAWVSYIEAIAQAFAKIAYVKLSRPREPHQHRLAITVSWV